MSTISGSEIENLITLFNNRGQKFYHACQYKDFKTYVQLGGVPSRNLMNESGLPFTNFDTDLSDRNNEVWNKVFGNLEDFGFAFANGARNPQTAPTPNPYGPILLIFNPEVFREAIDIAICLRSAGGRTFNRVDEALATADIVNGIYKFEDISEAPTNFSKAYIKFSDKLKEKFNNHEATAPEVSCNVENERLTFTHLNGIIIDPYTFDGQNLLQKVRQIKNANHINGWIIARKYSDGRLEIKQELANLSINETVTISQIIQNENSSENLRDWASRIKAGNRDFFYNRFVRYLHTGTILELNSEG